MWGYKWNTNEHSIAQHGRACWAMTKAPCQWTNNRSYKRYGEEKGIEKKRYNEKIQYYAQRAKNAKSKAA